jgi:hypothetical protein
MKAHSLFKTAILLFQLLPALATAATLSQPDITPAGDDFEDAVEIAMFSGNPGAIIYYTTDGSVPDASDTPFTFPFTITESTTVKAIAIRAGDTDSLVTAENYVIAPTVETPTPTVTITGKKSIKTKKTKVKISGTTTNATSVEYQVGVDGDFKTAKGTDTWSIIAKLKPGKNVIFVYAIGELEDSEPAKITVTLLAKK